MMSGNGLAKAESKNIHLVLASKDIGGMEKRFISFWIYARQLIPARLLLVTTHELIEKISQDKEFSEIQNLKDKIRYLHYSSGKVAIHAALRKYQAAHSGDIFHFIMKAPLFYKNSNTIFTFVCNSFQSFSLLHKIYFLYQFMYSNLIDILDPIIEARIKRLFFFKKQQIFLTPNPGLLMKMDTLIPYRQRRNKIVFVSRFVKGKGIERLLTALPLIFEQLKKNNIQDPKIIFYGYGPMEEMIRNCIRQLPHADIDIQYAHQIMEDISDAKIFLSLQQYNNYPSRSLLEALQVGVIPLVTDSGNSTDMAYKEFSYYLPEQFTPNEISAQIIHILKTDHEMLDLKAGKAKAFIHQFYNIENMGQYYLGLYDSLQHSDIKGLSK